MNCAGVIKFNPNIPIIVPKKTYELAVKRWGQEECDKMNLKVAKPIPLENRFKRRDKQI